MVDDWHPIVENLLLKPLPSKRVENFTCTGIKSSNGIIQTSRGSKAE
jgi:hypothetical protein